MTNADELKSKIKALAAEKTLNTQLRVRFKRATPPGEPGREASICSFWSANADMKRELRHLQLAYALVRGRSYWRTERHCAERPLAEAIALHAEVSTEVASAWLSAEVSPAELFTWNEHIVRSRDAALASRKQVRAA